MSRISRRQFGAFVGASAGLAGTHTLAQTLSPTLDQQSPSVRLTPASRMVGDVMPFYHNGEYHLFYLLNNDGNENINWEHAVSRDLIHWKHLPPAIVRDPDDKNGPEGGCMFTGSIIEKDGLFHAFYTSYNPNNPNGREFICHATSTDLISWLKHPADMIAPDGIHYADHQARDFRDPCVIWDDDRDLYIMYILANKPGQQDWVYGVLTSPDLKRWTQREPIEDIPGDECPDYFSIAGTHYLHSARIYASAKSRQGPWQYPIDYNNRPTVRNKLDRPMAAKRVYDGKRHVWFGGWLYGSASIPREVYEDPRGMLYMKPVDEAVSAFGRVKVNLAELQLDAGESWQSALPNDYLLDTSFFPEDRKSVILTIRDEKTTGNSKIVLSPRESAIMAIGGEYPSSGEIPFEYNKPVSLKAFVVGNVAEIFVNSRYAATFLIGSVGGFLSIKAQGRAIFRNFQIRIR